MSSFISTLNTTLLLFLFIIAGYILRKGHILPDSAESVLSKLENTLLIPAVVISTFIDKFTIENFSQRWPLILISAVIIAVLIPISILVSHILGHDANEIRIFRYSTVISNFSFFGVPLVSGAFGQEALFSYLIFCIPFYAVCYSIGVVWLIPADRAGRITIRSFANPVCVSLLIGMILGLLRVPLPAFVGTALTNASSCMGPIAMLLTGFVVAGYELRALLGDARVYLMAALRLIVIPGVFVLVLGLFTQDETILFSALCALAMPLGLNTIVIPAAYDGDTRIGASCALISSVLAVVTIPLMFMLLV